jgi:hypothetical protein
LRALGDCIWKNLRRFSGRAFAGCVSGALADCQFFPICTATSATFSNTVSSCLALAPRRAGPGITTRESHQLGALSNQQFAAFDISYPMHFLCNIYMLRYSIAAQCVGPCITHTLSQVSTTPLAIKSMDRRRKPFDLKITRRARVLLLARSMHLISNDNSDTALVVSSGKRSCGQIPFGKGRASFATHPSAFRTLEAAVVVFVASAFLLFSPAIHS